MQSQTNGNKELSTQITEEASTNKKSVFLIWCHLCRKNIPGYDAFKMHIMKRHRPTSSYYIGHTDCDSSYDDEEKEDNEDLAKPIQSFHKEHIFVDNEVETFECDSEIETSKPIKKLKRNNSYSSEDILDDSKEEICNEDLQANSVEVNESLLSGHLKNKLNNYDFLKNDINSWNIQPVVNGSQTSYFNPTMNIFPKYNLTNQAFAQSSNSQFIQVANQLPVASYVPQQLRNPPFIQNLSIFKNMENNFEKNTPECHYISESNTTNSSSISKTNYSTFEFNIENIISWNKKLKKLCKQLNCPLPPGILKKLKYIQQAIENCQLLKSCSMEEKKSLLKICEDLDKIILNHVEK